MIMTFENYMTYITLSKGKWGSPEELKEDALYTFKTLMPSHDTSWSDSIEDQSTDKGIKFQFSLPGGETIHMFKVSPWRASTESWEFYLNKKKIKSDKLQKTLENKYLSNAKKFLKYATSYDFEAQYIDNGGQYKAAMANNREIEDMFDDLNDFDKKSAILSLNKFFNKEKVSRVFH